MKAVPVLIVGVLFIFIGRVLWKKGDVSEPVWLTILGAIGDIFSGDLFSSFRGLAILLYFIGFILFMLSCLSLLGVIHVKVA